MSGRSDAVPTVDELQSMADAAHSRALSQSCGIAKTIALTEAVTFARLAGFGWDGTIPVFLEWQFANHLEALGADDLALQYRASALNLADYLADRGDESMAEMVVRAGPVLPAAIIAEAKRQRADAHQDKQPAAGVDAEGARNPYAGMPPPPPGFTIN